ncbi:MAG: DUF6502 family protein [Woeseiaceae bacterium]|nr:DUF6502 family protein [Woeseiaceae bacterium]
MDQAPLKPVITAFFTRLLRPVARVLLRYGVSFRELSELCKKVYVDVATDEFGMDGRPTNVSRVALLTGMTRRDVRKVRVANDEEEQHSISRMNTCARVLSGWFQDSQFCAADGTPLPLPESGASPSFHDLAKRYAGDIPVTATLKELKRAGAVSVAADGTLLAKSRDYMPGERNPAAPEAITRSGSVLEDIGNTVDWNLVRGPNDAPRFERRATNIRVGADSVDEFRDFVNREGQAFLERIDAWLSDHEVSDDKQATVEAVRLGLGIYWIQNPKIEE